MFTWYYMRDYKILEGFIMKTNLVNETKERKSFKEVVKESKWKILAGTTTVVSVVAIGVTAVALKDNTTMFEILSEGVLQDAITTTNNKINGRKQQLRILEDLIKRNPNDDGLIKKSLKIKGELDVLFKRLSKYTKKLYLYEIEDVTD